MKREDRPLEQIQKAKEHVVYEWHQLEYSKRLLDSMRNPTDPQYLQANVSREEHALALTVFALHARNLILFFELIIPKNPKSSRYSDDVLASDYFDEPNKWVQVRPQIKDRDETWLEAQKKRMDKLAAHITYYRNEPSSEKVWDIEDIFEYLSNLWQSFKETASPDRWTSS